MLNTKKTEKYTP